VLVEQHAHVIRLGQPGGRPGAQHQREAALDQRARDQVGQRREDRVLQLRPFSTRLTVASLTPTFLATSASLRVDVRVMPQRYDTQSKRLRDLTGAAHGFLPR
jgi:hypothetical protein